MPQFTPTFDAKQLNEELLGRSYLLAPEIEVYVKNLIRIVGEQDEAIKQLRAVVKPDGVSFAAAMSVSPLT